ncbi:hypothetical protein CMU71_03830 [Elizabethkingia anophelis]|jgi:hypothetical protein|uniref:Uncharacterized protein n=1 Tax=Elizabethkingia miricola TaxID=172045 RepID=A0ABD5B7D5_ELIMR|nr:MULTISPECIES: hypothetical protein [Elizabethkingia]MDQ8749262.1 hypothetical protein [Elizabethkingia miricola]MDV3498921.1 hypothetical protein [Elizabethkingia anophelis]MDV3566023.1 hypothetical protein [Elizabethkingia anophelis]MDV3971904.1 hypothetical protein [Elizabethkingia anophelis]MDV3995467.1 hypothetical protein [Elizabethkingia anophelis]
MRLVKNISFFLIIGFIITKICECLKSEFLFKYLQDNIIGLLLTLLAINTATLGLIASKIQDFIEKYEGMSFVKTIKEMKFSLKEQVVLIGLSIVVLILLKSEIINFEFKDTLCNSVLVSVLLYSVVILYDTGKAVFVIIELIEGINKHKEDQ